MPDLVTPPLVLLAVAVGAYLLGSVPFGLVMARLFGLGDLRAIGSGNIGATNVLRTGNKLAAFLTLVGDSGKGALAVILARGLVADDAGQVAALAAFLGHAFPVYLRFRGGKAVATFLGTLLAVSVPLGAATCLGWLAFAAATRISSVGALGAAAVAPAAALWLRPEAVALALAMGALIWAFHRANLKRLVRGEEPRIGSK